MTHYLPADDARCLGIDCPKRDTCLRFLCRNDIGILLFAAFEPEHCDYYLEVMQDEE